MGDSISNCFALLVLEFYKGKVKSLNSCMSSVFLLFYSEKSNVVFSGLQQDRFCYNIEAFKLKTDFINTIIKVHVLL